MPTKFEGTVPNLQSLLGKLFGIKTEPIKTGERVTWRRDDGLIVNFYPSTFTLQFQGPFNKAFEANQIYQSHCDGKEFNAIAASTSFQHETEDQFKKELKNSPSMERFHKELNNYPTTDDKSRDYLWEWFHKEVGTTPPFEPGRRDYGSVSLNPDSDELPHSPSLSERVEQLSERVEQMEKRILELTRKIQDLEDPHREMN